jgi:hypothetical protein
MIRKPLNFDPFLQLAKFHLQAAQLRSVLLAGEFRRLVALYICHRLLTLRCHLQTSAAFNQCQRKIWRARRITANRA